MNPSTSPPRGRLVEPGHSFAFTVDGQRIGAESGQSIAAALFAAGQRIFSRSFKYHRPRGLFCVAGECPNCLMEVDGRPNVRTCIEPARPEQVVRHQNAWPSLEFDALRLFDRLDRLLPVGFYYKRFYKPRWVWPLFECVVRQLAGNGRVDVDALPARPADVEHLFADMCVIGGGPAGLAAAASAAGAGATVVLLERLPRLGGHLLFENEDVGPTDSLLAEAGNNSRIRTLTDTTAFGLYEGNLVAAFTQGRLLKLRAKHVIVCTGGRERPFVFHNNDLPGIMLGRGALRLGRLYGVPAGQRAVVVSDHDGGRILAAALEQQGIEIAGVIDVRVDGAAGDATERWPTWTQGTVLAARGAKRVCGLDVGQLDHRNATVIGPRTRIDCDLVCVASSLLPVNELLLQAGARFEFTKRRWQIARTVEGVSAAGAAAGTLGLTEQILEGRLRGAEAAQRLGFAVTGLTDLQSAWSSVSAQGDGVPPSCLLPAGDTAARKRFVCLCEDVTEKDLVQAVAEGFDEVETLKRYSTVNMGPCQGKVCGHAAVEVCARATCRDVHALGTTTSRPPVAPVELGVLAATQFHPVRRTPMHHWHEQHGARWLDAGHWKRPESYGNPVAEVQAIRSGVGVIDVSTLGKLELVGPDAAELLERVYVNRWAGLKPGAARYGVMCNEDGIVFDDGVGTRLSQDHFYITATTGNAEAVFQWLEQWRATWGLNVVVLNQTSGLGAMNLAGPHARAVLRKLSKLDLASSAFPYLGYREAEVAGVRCRLFRIGFVGELGYEIHCRSASALHVWEAVFDAGRDFGIRPGGIEAQRILRLEKGHPIVTVDTDALSNPLEAGLEWLVHFDKPRFHGREPLARLKARGPRSRLVGFAMEEPQLVPEEGCQVVDNGRPVGRVTSARYSPTLKRSIGLAWVPACAAEARNRFHIRWNETDRAAIIRRLPFYDPAGKRVRS